MKKKSLISNIFLTLSLVATSAFIANSYAAESYYIELGKPAGVEQTQEQWRDLSLRYKALSRLKFFPKSKVTDGVTTSTIQAGPISEKAKAQKICNYLFARDVPCFVIEGIEKSPPTMSIAMIQAGNSEVDQPYLIPQEELRNDVGATQSSASEQSIIIETNSEQEQAARDADVDVAQAIPVPLSANTISTILPDNTAPTKSQDRPKFNLVQFSSTAQGRLIIEAFSSEGSANKFWNYINDESPELVSGGINVRVQRPLSTGRSRGIQLSIGVFENGDSAASFCNNTVGGYDSRLRCRYDVNPVEVAKSEQEVVEKPVETATPATPEITSSDTIQHSNSYKNRRRLLQHKVPAQQNYINNNGVIEVSDNSGNKFWAQVVIADTKTEASRRLDEIKKTNKDVIGDAGSVIMSSVSSHAKFTVRLGPFGNEDDANHVCDNLQLRGVDCLIITTK